ncbi:hypothetical protein F7725_022085 [Dissostichus mawsoni]|uniref:Uncharacterized protein n=1 Tax=Dissostichus mawsoni TaxID=36200 RepID=A0A7J5ZDI1_DISMA|nr:hypothetical protein F7725_022085 [Dissostichus mawsoni]
MQRSVRKRRLVPQQDAEQHIKLRTDKAGLEEHFIDQFKGIGEFIRFAIRLVCYLYEQFQVTNEQYNPEAVEEERLPLDLSSLKTSITDRSSTEFQVTNEQYNPEAVEEERLPLELTSLKTSTTDRSSTEFQVTNEQYNPEAVEEERLPLELTSLKTSTTDRSSTEFQVTNEQYNPEAVEEERLPLELTSLKTSTTDRSSTELFTVRGYSLVDYPDTDEEDEDFIQNCDEGNPKLRITEDVLIQTDLAGSDVSTADSEEEYVPNPREGESTDSEGSIEIPIIKKSSQSSRESKNISHSRAVTKGNMEQSHTTNKASDSMPPDDEPAVFVNAVMTKEDGSRKYNKKHYCYYCELQVQKIPDTWYVLWRHFQSCKFKPEGNRSKGRSRVQALCAFAEPARDGFSDACWKFLNGVIQDTEESEGEASMSSLPGKFLTKHQKSAKKRGDMKSDYDESASV